MGLGKNKTKLDQDALKGKGSELFKKTEQEPTSLEERISINRGPGRPAERRNTIRKSLYLDEEVSERLRKFCYEQRRKENHVVTEALVKFLTEAGY